MVKKLFLLAALLLPSIALAQYGSGSWKVHPFFVSAKVQNVVDTHSKVYYLVSGNLYCYDKATGANESFNSSNKLSDVTITGMYYNDIKDYVLLTYDNSNIDIVLSDGRVVNMPEIKDAVVPQSKVINHVTFDNGHAYVATAYGFGVIDDSKFAFTENHFYGVSFSSVAHVGEKLVVGYGPNVRACNFTAKREKYTSFPTVGLNRTTPAYMPIDDTHFFCNSTDSLEVVTVVGNAYEHVTIAPNRATSIQRTPTGFVANFPSAGYYITTDADGGNVTKTTIKGEMLSCSPNSDGTMWAMGPNGLHKLGESGTAVKPDGIGISTTAFWATYNPGENKFYLASTTDNFMLSSANKGAKTEIWAYDGEQWEDVTPPNVPLWNSGQDTYQGNYWLNFVPGTKNQYVCATRAAGVMNVVDGNVAAKYHYASDTNCNIPLKDKYKSATAIDSAGNLWLVQSYKNLSKLVAVLPKEKLLNTAEEVVTADWITPTVSGVYAGSFKCSSFAISKKTDIKVFSSGGFQKAIVLWDNEGNINNLTPKTKSFTQLKGHEGDAISWDYVMCLFAASNGDIWVGTNAGVFSMNPKEAFTAEDYTVNHIRSIAEDGSEDYLAGGAQVNCIAEDKYGRKFVGTHNDGLYIVSEDGSQVIKHFTTENSVLQANCIYNIAYNDATNSILIVTMNGVCEYVLDVTPSAEDYSNVSVFPNPVRPDFTGYVTISQLMDKSNVQIVDDNGNVLMETVSDGGICHWNCCNYYGERVPTGTYTVMASQGGEMKAVAKFLVIK